MFSGLSHPSPLVCSGQIDSGGSAAYTANCYIYDFATKTWSLRGVMPGGFGLYMAVAYHTDWGMVITGGHQAGPALSRVTN